jgi:Flp pilus assembly protein TadG
MRSSRDSRNEHGAAALEFGLVLPLVMAVIFGMLQYGYHFWALQTAAATARETARLLVVGSDWECAQAHGVTFSDAAAVEGDAPTVTRRYHAANGDPQAAPVLGSMVTVTVSFQSLDIGLYPLPDGGVVTQSATARIENVPPARLKCDESQDVVPGGSA